MIFSINKKSIISNAKTNFLAILLLTFYLSEAYGKYELNINDSSQISRILKFLACVYALYQLRRDSRFLIEILLFICCFICGQLFINPNFDSIILVNVLKYLFPFLLFNFFSKSVSHLDIISIRRTFETLILFNSGLIILGFIFKIDLLETYGGYRFGYNGLLISSATSTYVYLISLVYFLITYKEKFILKLKSIIVLLSVLLIGTKSLYATLIIVLIFYFLNYTSNLVKMLSIISISIIGAIGSYYIFYQWELFNNIRLEEGLLSSILSNRNKLFYEEMIPFILDNWTSLNYLFGGINDITTRPQMALLDLIYFFGLIGSIYYLYLYKKYYVNFKLNKSSIFFFSLLFGVIFISGNFFLNASVVIYMVIIREIIYSDNIINS